MRFNQTVAVRVGLACTVLAACTGTDGSDQPVVERQRSGIGISECVTYFRYGAWPTSSYNGTEETEIRRSEADSNFYNQTTCTIDGGDDERACLFEWDVGSIPSTATVLSVTLGVRAESSSLQDYEVYELKRAWRYTESTWNKAKTLRPTPWEVSGAKGSSDRGALVGLMDGNGHNGEWLKFEFNATGVAMVQSWVNGGQNRGFIIANANNSDALRIRSSDHATTNDRPLLTVRFAPEHAGEATGGGPGYGCI